MLPLILQAGAGEARLDIISLILNASPVVKGMLGLLILMSAASWFVIASKTLYLSAAASRSAKFQDAFWKTGRLDEIWRMSEAAAPSPVGEVFRAGYTELAKLQKRRQENADPASEAFLGDIESVERASIARGRRPSPRWSRACRCSAPRPAPARSSACSARCGAS